LSEQFLWLIPLGFVVGTVGTMIGAGGGFLLVPVLLLMYPGVSPDNITAISLAVIFFNALSGTFAYSRMGRIDYRSGLLFALVTVPGAILGVLSTDKISRQSFNAIFGSLMLMLSLYLIFHKPVIKKKEKKKIKAHTTRRITEKNGATHVYSFDMKIGMWISLITGYLSSLLGIGGGIIHVPSLVRLLNFPVHIATATSHLTLLIMAFTGTLVHIVTGSFSRSALFQIVFLVSGVLPGAQVGAVLSSRLHGQWILRVLAVALAFTGIRIAFMAF
jgi:uncharacterized membrane protein YfcA